MKIGIIGAGQIGAALIRQYSKAGHEIKMANAGDIEKLHRLQDETGAKVASLIDVVKNVDVVVVSIPLTGIPRLAEVVKEHISTNTIIIDTTNYYPIRDGSISEIENGMPESIWVSNYFDLPVVKAYNSILAGSLIQAGLPESSTSRIALPISGNSQQAKNLVATLVNDSGFDAVDIGNLQDSWRQQPGSPIYCADLNTYQLKKNLSAAKKELLPQRRELALQFILKQNPELWTEWRTGCIANNRNVYETDLRE